MAPTGPSRAEVPSRLTGRLIWRWSAHCSSVWCVLFAASILLGYTVSGTVWSAEQLPLFSRVGLVAFSGIALVPLAGTLATPLLILTTRFDRSRWHRWRILRWMVSVLSVAIVWIAVFLYAASWACFAGTQHFLDLVALTFWFQNPVQLLQHIVELAPAALIAIPLASIAATGALWLTIARPVARTTAVRCRRLTLGAVLGVTLCAAFSSRASIVVTDLSLAPIHDRTTGRTTFLVNLYKAARGDRTGPMSHLAVWIADRRERALAVPPVTVDAPIVKVPLQPIRQYISGVPRGRVHHWNVIVIVVESLRADELAAYGATRSVMPAVDRIAGESRVYTHNLTTATHSNYASVVPLSGDYPMRSTQPYTYAKHLSYPRVLIYDILKALGYHTAVFSSQNEYWGGMYYFLDTGGIDHFLHSETYHGPTYVPHDDLGLTQFVLGTGHAGKIDDRYTVTEAIRWLDSLYAGPKRAAPFFVYMNLQSSHIPYQRPADFPPRFGTGHTSFTIGWNDFPRDSVSAVKDVYSNSLAYADAQIARLHTSLKRLGLWDSTIVVLTGDHGEAFFEHGFAAHANLPYAELTNTPLIIHAPGLAPGLDNRPAQHVDVPPTVLSLLGLPPHPAYQGIDLTTKDIRRDRPLYVIAQTFFADASAIVRGRYRLILDARHHTSMLYDDVHDPGEMHDLADSLPSLRYELTHELNMWRKVQLQYYTREQAQAWWYPPRLQLPPLQLPRRTLASTRQVMTPPHSSP